MLKYETAKALKDAGYPQKSAGDRINPKGYLEYSGCWDDSNEDDYITLPTLSELIEACGDKFGDLTLIDAGRGKCWFANSYKVPAAEASSSPEEAVAKLYIELNKV